MADVKKMEFKSICVLSVFRYFGGVFLIAGLMIGLFANIFNITLATPQLVKALPFMANVTSGIPAGVAFAIMYGLSAGIGFSIFALLYNLFASIMGGIKCLVKEE
ncbi:MAG: hypothetical protein KKD29_04505 [Candidatus Omnitrophica bacterium]|nr:hypothetical protein [Candidatus Omnitrophota bacterium]MBU4488562.1 hypothetical protein [Candidatus Omnitrophota bacterium]MCG2705437.1 hypothetical protein [Candidatus Omnitrophota bacterium]